MLPTARQLCGLFRERHLDWNDYAAHGLSGALGTYLDYGCGPGVFLGRVVRQCTAAYGVDIDAAALAQARRAVADATVLHIDPHAPLPFADGVFDVISILEVIEHVADERAVLRELARVLRPGGWLLLTTPHRGLLTFLDPGNVKVVLPRLHRFMHRTVLRNRDYYDGRFGEARQEAQGMLADFTLDRIPWHRHYSFSDIRRLTPEVLETIEWRAYFPLMRAFLFVALAVRVLTRGRIAGLTGAAYRQYNRLSRVNSLAGDQLVVLFRKRQA